MLLGALLAEWHMQAKSKFAITCTACTAACALVRVLGRGQTFFLGLLGLGSVLGEASESSRSSSTPSMKAFPLTVMGPLPCSYASRIEPDIRISPPEVHPL